MPTESTQPASAKARPRMRVRTVVALCLLVPVLLVTAGYLGLRFMMGTIPTVNFTPMNFESSVWKVSPSKFSWESTRLRMVDDLLARGVLTGKTKAEVAELLGAADDTPYFHAANRFVFHLGQERHPFGIDSEWLLIDFGEDGRVTQARLARD